MPICAILADLPLLPLPGRRSIRPSLQALVDCRRGGDARAAEQVRVRSVHAAIGCSDWSEPKGGQAAHADSGALAGQAARLRGWCNRSLSLHIVITAAQPLFPKLGSPSASLLALHAATQLQHS